MVIRGSTFGTICRKLGILTWRLMYLLHGLNGLPTKRSRLRSTIVAPSGESMKGWGGPQRAGQAKYGAGQPASAATVDLPTAVPQGPAGWPALPRPAGGRQDRQGMGFGLSHMGFGPPPRPTRDSDVPGA